MKIEEKNIPINKQNSVKIEIVKQALVFSNIPKHQDSLTINLLNQLKTSNNLLQRATKT